MASQVTSVRIGIPAKRWAEIEAEARLRGIGPNHMLNRTIKFGLQQVRRPFLARMLDAVAVLRFGVLRPGPVPGIFEAETLAAPPNLAGRDFAEAWARWCSYRRSKGMKMKLRVMRGHMLGCARLGMPAAVEAIDFAIANGWNSLAVCMGREPQSS